MTKKKIQTNNRELYEKLNMLNFAQEVVLRNVPIGNINRIVKQNSSTIEHEKAGDYHILKKKKNINWDVYLLK